MIRRYGLTIVELIVILVILGIAAAILFPVFTRSRDSDRRSPGMYCQSNLKQIALGMAQYAGDYEDKLPLVKGASVSGPSYNPAYGWADAVEPYLKSTQIFQCPSEPTDPKVISTTSSTGVSALDPQFTDYWFNARLRGVSRGQLQFVQRTFLLGDGNDGTEKCDARYALSRLPGAWRTNSGSPAQRHLGGANYAFADGHVKWLPPEKVTADPPENSWSFLPGPYLPG
jgi:prepilin-type processing-associated H-X9-DG protein